MSFLTVKKYQFSFFYALSTAISVVLIQQVQDVAITISLFICTIAATIFFHLANEKKMIIVYKAIFDHWLLWFASAITIFGVWWCSFYAIQTIGATASIFIYFIMGAISSYCYEIFYKKFASPIQIIKFIGMIFMLAATCFLFVPAEPKHIGFVVAGGGGIMGYLYGKATHQLGVKARITATQILAVRFYLLIGVLAWFIELQPLKIAIEAHWLALGLITLCSFIIPLYCYQRGIATIGPEAHTVIIASTPILMVLLQIIVKHQLSIAQLFIGVGIMIFIAPKLLEKLILKRLNN